MERVDCGGRRLGIARRQLSLSISFPDKRVIQDRRSGTDRRSGLERRSSKGFRVLVNLDRRRFFTPDKQRIRMVELFD